MYRAVVTVLPLLFGSVAGAVANKATVAATIANGDDDLTTLSNRLSTFFNEFGERERVAHIHV